MAQSTVTVQQLADTTVTTTAETVVLTISGVSTGSPDARVAVFGLLSMTHGTGATAVTLRVRRTSLTGTLVGESNALSVTAGNSSEQNFGVLDTSIGEVAGQSYVLTAQFTGATGNSTITSALSTAIVNA